MVTFKKWWSLSDLDVVESEQSGNCNGLVC